MEFLNYDILIVNVIDINKDKNKVIDEDIDK